MRIVILVLLLAGCGVLTGSPSPEGVGAIEGNVDKVEIVQNAGLLWWQWIVIGMFIPSPIEMIANIARFWKGVKFG